MRFPTSLLISSLTLLACGAPGFAHAACTVTLLRPANDATVTAPPTFRWSATEDCQRYRVQVNPTMEFGPAATGLGWKPTTRTTMTQATYDALTAEGTATWYWRVQGRDAAGTTTNTAPRAITLTTQDADGDGYVDEGYGGTDCDDADGAIHPGAAEVCNGFDDDCDGVTDNGGGTAWYDDSDGDGHGHPSVMVLACDAPAGFVAVGDDCDDSSASIHPGATEASCSDGVDQDCDGSDGECEGYRWNYVGVGDCSGHDITQTAPSPEPDVGQCSESQLGLAAVCWDNAAYYNVNLPTGGCTYKTLSPEACVGGANPGFMYVCVAN
ncbi:putative metal-binding motif-containing protein [Myxococcota bacterium]|nr:putative metal-binding motif-containing protein [Myxococcota bacterium]